jgi:GntR family transcriptional regulator
MTTRRFIGNYAKKSLLKEGDAVPSVRQVAADFQLNPITVSRAYQELADEQLIEKRRGLGMYVIEGARDKLLQAERDRFLTEEWPQIRDRIMRFGLDLKSLLAQTPVAVGASQ